MTRYLAIAVLAIACHEPPLNAPAPQFASVVASDSAPPAHFIPGEVMEWNLYVRGISLGRLKMTVSPASPARLEASLAQSRFGRNFGRLGLHLSTEMARSGYPLSALTDTSIGGNRRRTSQQFDGNSVRWSRGTKGGTSRAPMPIHSALSAVGALRGPNLPRRIFVAVGLTLYELSLSVPTPEIIDDVPVIRVDAEAKEAGKSRPVGVATVWLSDDDQKLPVRFDFEFSGLRMVAKIRR